MARNILLARLSDKSQLTPTIIELDFKMEEPKTLPFKAGQFVMLNIPPKEGQKRPTLRAYSLASNAHEPSGFKLVIKLLPSGVGSDYIRSLNLNDTLNFTGPFGRLLFLEPPTRQVLMLSTGAGISQHVSYLLTHGMKYPDITYRMLIGIWNEQEIFYQKELNEIKKTLKDFEFHFVVDKPTPEWKGYAGFVTHHLDKLNYKKFDSTFYLCGNPAMINSVTEELKRENFALTKILAEAFS